MSWPLAAMVEKSLCGWCILPRMGGGGHCDREVIHVKNHEACWYRHVKAGNISEGEEGRNR